jgi:hypothetical protein
MGRWKKNTIGERLHEPCNHLGSTVILPAANSDLECMVQPADSSLRLSNALSFFRSLLVYISVMKRDSNVSSHLVVDIRVEAMSR